MRKKTIENLSVNEFDLLIIGGGITGVGIALDAQSRGLSTALVEMQDFSSGTSSRSTKLIHGGLRYLKQLEFKLVNEVGRERAIVHKIAPHLVHPDKMLLPLIKGGNYGKYLTSFGLSVYDWLAGVEGDDRRKMLDKAETEEMEPLLRTDILEGSGYYAEYRTDDSRLVLSIAKTAQKYGATLLNYAKAEGLLYDENGIIQGVKILDDIENKRFEVRAKTVVNATGPWVDELRAQDGSLSGKRLHLTKGVHLVIAKKRLPINQTIYFDNEDGRMIFAVPRGRAVYLGTTDTSYSGEKVNPDVTKSDLDYVLMACNQMFPGANLVREDVESSWAGLRPLIHEEGKSPSQLSRKDEIFESKSGLISIAGGKLTGYRKMSERVVDLVCKYQDQSNLKCITDKINLLGGEFEDYQQVESFIEQLMAEFPALELNEEEVSYLVHNYGTSAQEIIEIAANIPEEKTISLAIAEADYTMDNEMVERSLDFFERRTGRVNFHIGSIKAIKEKVLERMAKRLKWDPERLQMERNLLEGAMQRVTRFL